MKFTTPTLMGAVAVAALLCTACGSGNSDDADLTLDEFTVTPTTPDSSTNEVKFIWKVNRSDLSNYRFSVYLIPSSTPDADRKDDNRVFNRNCTSGVAEACENGGQVNCDYERDGDNRRFKCSDFANKEFSIGSYRAVGRACFTESDFDEKCQEKIVDVTLN
ncbi:MAG: hypothetical protein HY308_10175 [Gammaproteobacteria bacterium]|nr:hypothetical protein [Gammaproteobacteria bacterium]